jgi:hypothetical protein
VLCNARHSSFPPPSYSSIQEQVIFLIKPNHRLKFKDASEYGGIATPAPINSERCCFVGMLQIFYFILVAFIAGLDGIL